MTKRIFSAVQPTGELHLGNYLGAMKQFTQITDEAFFCVADLHAITMPYVRHSFAENTRLIAATFIALGLHETGKIFVQSSVPAHSELAWLLQSVARVGWLDRMTQFRQKTNAADDDERYLDLTIELAGGVEAAFDRVRAYMSKEVPHLQHEDISLLYNLQKVQRNHREGASVGLFTYPVLMAADILAYKATHVPVGADQLQHLNLARDIARRFANEYGGVLNGKEVMIMPEAIMAPVSRVMSLTDPTKKMSKSDENGSSRINLRDKDDLIARKIKKATASTDPVPDFAEFEKASPGARNLVSIYAATMDQSIESVCNEYVGTGWGSFKPILTELLISVVGPIRDKTADVLASGAVEQALSDGTDIALDVSSATLREVRKLMGFY